MLLKRTADHSGKLMGYDIPAGTTIIPNFHAVHMDPTIWPEPEKFDPYRHIDKEGKFVHSHKIIPFSLGPRFCPGEQLARVEAYIYFAKLLQKYKILPGDQPPNIDGITSVVHFPKTFRIEQR
uniref:Cytochrome P450 2C42-like n=1 Tax=Phallusia mammillata TaxID=59560 RepID=A0A6F9DAY5_9ASCI|nr:cytochrome P450 2C42-like [Phallusia mammillata]